jgi:hypothetical protein
MAGMSPRSRAVRSLTVAMVAAVWVVVAGCSADRTAGLTTTAIVRLPSGFHAPRPTDDTTSTRAAAKGQPAAAELATLRLEGAHRRAVAATADEAAPSVTGGFVCQIDMGTAPLD